MVGCFFSPYRKKDVFEKSMFCFYERHPFESIEVNIPRNFDSYLSSIYGEYMELPPQDERNTRHTITELRLRDSYDEEEIK